MNIGGMRPEEARVFDSEAGYHRLYGTSFEIFWDDGDGNEVVPGWYYWSCQPGCLPDGDAVGPFPTSIAALHDLMDVLEIDLEGEDE